MKKWIVFHILLTLIAGCVNQGVKPEERDRTGKFDGVWFATINIENQYNEYGRWGFNCSKAKFNMTLYIADGQMSSFKTEKGSGYIREDGSFYVNEPYGVWGTSGGDMASEKHLIFSGKLSNDRGEGDVVVAFDMNNYGCKGKVKFRKRSY